MSKKERAESFSAWFNDRTDEEKVALAVDYAPPGTGTPDVDWFVSVQAKIMRDIISGTVHPGMLDLLNPAFRNILDGLRIIAATRAPQEARTVVNVITGPEPAPRLVASYDTPGVVDHHGVLGEKRAPAGLRLLDGKEG